MEAALIVVSGASGFIGRALVARWRAQQRPLRALVRSVDPSLAHRPDVIAIGDLARASDDSLAAALDGAFAVVHLAGRAHVMRERIADVDAAYHDANVVATERLARAAVRANVERFVLASTVKVHGESSARGRPLRPDDPFAPADAYARSKRDAERALLAVTRDTATAPIVLRLPLVYGPGAKGNFAMLIDVIARERRLPVAGIDAPRSIAFVGNVGAAIEAVLDAKRAPIGAHFVADRESVDIATLSRAIGDALGVPARLFDVPAALLRLAAALAGRSGQIARLATPLEVDTSSLRAATGFVAPYTLTEGLAATAAWWRAHHAL
jgi:UDP-glucose 4-epimerase